jgi:DNA gyrase subunit B
MSKETRMLRQVEMEDAEDAERVFTKLMGSEVGPRRDFIVEYGGLLDRERIDA